MFKHDECGRLSSNGQSEQLMGARRKVHLGKPECGKAGTEKVGKHIELVGQVSPSPDMLHN